MTEYDLAASNLLVESGMPRGDALEIVQTFATHRDELLAAMRSQIAEFERLFNKAIAQRDVAMSKLAMLRLAASRVLAEASATDPAAAELAAALEAP